MPKSIVLCAVLMLGGLECGRTDTAETQWLPGDGIPSGLVGCYALYRGDGQAIDGHEFYNATHLVRLDTTSVGKRAEDTIPGTFRLLVPLDSAGKPVESVDPKNYIGPFWWADSLTDSVRLTFSDGFSGASLVLEARKDRIDTLIGIIENHWDVGPPFATDRTAARALRLSCTDGGAG
jgi:hypothetical protein